MTQSPVTEWLPNLPERFLAELEFIHLSVNNSDKVIHDTCLSRADHDQTHP